MKKLLVFLFMIFTCANINILRAETINMQWLNEDGTVYDTTSCAAGGDVILPTVPTKRGYTFMGWKKIHTRIEYLESTGTQYINTGYMFESNKGRVVTKFMSLNNSPGIMNRMFGAYTSSNGSSRSMSIYVWNNLTVGCGETDLSTNIPIVVGQEYTLDITAADGFFSGTINGIALSGANSYIGSIMSYLPVYLFKTNENGLAGYPFKGRIYQLRIYDNDNLVRDFIPVRDDNSVPCMYDMVTKQFFYNAGTGDFVAGPTVNE